MELDSIYEEVLNYHINDYLIFEATLRRDYCEVSGILNEDGNKNFIQKIWAGIKKIFKIIVDKLKELLNKFLATISRIKASVFVKKYKKYYEKENGELKYFKYEKGFYKYKHSGSIAVKDFVPIDHYKNSEEIKASTEKFKLTKDLNSYIHDEIVDGKKLIYPFKEDNQLKNKIIEDILQLSNNREVENFIKRSIKDAEKNEKEIDNKMKDIKDDNSEELNKCKAYLEYLNVYKTHMINSTKIYCTEYLNIFKDYCALYKAGGEYLKSGRGEADKRAYDAAEKGDQVLKDMDNIHKKNQETFKNAKDFLNNSKEQNKNDFKPSNLLLKTLNTNPRDMYDIVGALMGYINADPNFKTNDFEDAIQYVLSNGVSKNDLFASFDNDNPLEKNKSKWDEDYYALSRVHLKDNFCRERINHVKEVGKYLGKNKSNKNSFKEESYIDIDYINAIVEAEMYELEL